MIDESSPTRHKLLPGISARRWASAVVVKTAVALFAVPMIVVFGYLVAQGQSPSIGERYGQAIIPIFVGLGAVAAVVVIVNAALIAREANHGYTTTSGYHLELDQVDVRTGIVIRFAGEPALSTEEFKTRSAALRSLEVHESEPSERLAGPSVVRWAAVLFTCVVVASSLTALVMRGLSIGVNGSAVVLMLVVVVGVPALVLVAYLLVRGWRVRQAQRLSGSLLAASPEDKALPTMRTRGLKNFVVSQVGKQHSALARPVVSYGPSGIDLHWSESAPPISFSWSDIASLDHVYVTTRYRHLRAVTVKTIGDDASFDFVPLMMSGQHLALLNDAEFRGLVEELHSFGE